VLDDFGVKGEIVKANPGPVVTLYELEPAPGIKSSRVIGLADDIARSMSALSARVAVVPGRNAIGIELPNAHRERSICASCSSEDTTRVGASCRWRSARHRRRAIIVDLADAASADRRHHRLGQVGRHQHHDPVLLYRLRRISAA
jgi:DNA segregation ATPase FtsK/SpoIIIE-like protein